MEERGLTQIYCGPGKGKTSVAIGQAVRAVGYGKRAIVIQFLKGKAFPLIWIQKEKTLLNSLEKGRI